MFSLILFYSVFFFVFSIAYRAWGHRVTYYHAADLEIIKLNPENVKYKNTENTILKSSKNIVEKTETWKTLEELHSL